MLFLAKKRNIFSFLKRRKDKSFLKTHNLKWLNLFTSSNYKTRSINFFYALLRAYKLKIRGLCLIKYNSFSVKSVPNNLAFPTFSRIFALIVRALTFTLELKVRKFKKSEVLTPVPISPWRGFRLGANLLFKNAKTRIQLVRRPRKVEKLYRILDELWDTLHGQGATCKGIKDFTTKVLESFENYRSTQLFPVREDRREVVSPSTFLFEKRGVNLKQKAIILKNDSFLKKERKTIVKVRTFKFN